MSSHSTPAPLKPIWTAQAMLLNQQGPPDTVLRFRGYFSTFLEDLKSREETASYPMVLQKIEDFVETQVRTAKPAIQCKRGCAACCHQSVACTEQEAIRIANYVFQKGIQLDEDRLQKQRLSLKESLRTFQLLTYEERTCIFLGEDLACRIYPVRPLVCRRHVVQNEARWCADGEASRLLFAVDPEVDAYLSAFYTVFPIRPLVLSFHQWRDPKRL